MDEFERSRYLKFYDLDIIINLFAFLLRVIGIRLGPKLTSLLYCQNSITTKKLIMKLYKCRHPAFLSF